MFNFHKKEAPLLGLQGSGGGLGYLTFSGAADTSYHPKRSTRFNPDDSAYLNRTPTSAGNRRTWTWSGWVKRGVISSGSIQTLMQLFPSGLGYTRIYFETTGELSLDATDSSQGNYAVVKTSARLVDPGAWYHICVAMDTTQSTEAHRLRMYVNGVQQTSFSPATYPAHNVDYMFNYAATHNIGRHDGNTQYFDGLISQNYLIDGLAIGPSYFGYTDPLTNTWRPKEFSAEGTTINDGTDWSAVSNYTLSGTGASVSNLGAAFNGSTAASPYATLASSGNATANVVFNCTSTDVTTVEVYVHSASSSGDTRGTCLDSTGTTHQSATLTSASQDWHTIYSGAPINLANVGWGINQNGASGTGSDGFRAFKINGEILIDSTTQNLAYGTNGFHLAMDPAESGTIYSDDITYSGSTGFGSGPQDQPENIFDGSTSTLAQTQNCSNPNSIIFTPTSAIPYSSTVEVYINNSANTVAFNNGSFAAISSGWNTIASGSGTVTKIEARRPSTNGASIHAIRIDGKYLINHTAIGHDSSGEENHWHENNLTAPSSIVAALGDVPYKVFANNSGINIDYANDSAESSGTLNSTTSASFSYNLQNKHAVFDLGASSGRRTIDAITGSGGWVIVSDDGTNWEQLGNQNIGGSNDVYMPNYVSEKRYFSFGGGGGVGNCSLTLSGDNGQPDRELDLLADVPGAPYDNGLNGGGNYPTWNPLIITTSTFSDGNLKLTTGSGVPTDFVTLYTPAGIGQWFWEFEIGALGGTNYTMTGMLPSDSDYVQGTSDTMHLAGGISYYAANGGINAASGAATTGTAGATFDIGDVIGWAFDAENGTLQCYKNGASQGTQFTNIRTDVGWVFCAHDYMNYSGSVYFINFGQKPFKYAPPEGFQSLNYANLPIPEVVRPDQYVSATIYTGNGASTPGASGGTQSINVGLEPDLIWIKDRTQQGHNHNLYDTIRGANSILMSDDTTAAVTNSTDAVTSFNSDGFTLGDNGEGTQSLELNKSGNNYVAWSWKAGGSSNTFNVDDVGYASASDVNMSVGGLNSSVYDQSQRWSDNMTLQPSTSPWGNGMGPEKAFNGVVDNSTNMAQRGDAAGGTITWTFSGLSGSVRVWIGNDGGTITDGNGTVRGNNDGSGKTWFDCSGDISDYNGSIVVSVSSDAPSLGGVEVAGKVLVDDNITPPSVPSVAATGASVGTKQGFSITVQTAVSGSGDTMRIAHGLTQKPDFIIGKDLDNGSTNWAVYHSALGATKKIELDNPAAAAANANYWNEEEPTSSLIYSNAASWMYTSASFVLYSWHNVPGLQKFGEYTGSGSDDGTFIELGFRPAIVIVKCTSDAGQEWVIWDDERSKYNENTTALYVNSAASESTVGTSRKIDFLSNGFKMRNGSSGATDYDGRIYIYAAWASSPLKYSNAR
jgi:hypothetical protein